MLHLFTVTDIFYLEGRGCVLLPGLPAEPGSPHVARGTKIKLRTPAGKEIETVVKDLEMISFRKKPDPITAPILLPKDISKDDLPPGTDVFLLV